MDGLKGYGWIDYGCFDEILLHHQCCECSASHSPICLRMENSTTNCIAIENAAKGNHTKYPHHIQRTSKLSNHFYAWPICWHLLSSYRSLPWWDTLLHPPTPPSVSFSAVITLSIFSDWSSFISSAALSRGSYLRVHVSIRNLAAEISTFTTIDDWQYIYN